MGVDGPWEHQRRTFERTAEEYARRRPSYPDELFADMKRYAALRSDERILEIGCGPGIATAPVAAWGHRMLCIEPAEAMIDIARRPLAAHPHVDFKACTFEEWDLEPGAFGLIGVAQAYHWLHPRTRHARIAEALRPGGTAAIFWNAQVTPPEHLGFFVKVQDVYREHAPELMHHGDFRTEPYQGHALRDETAFVDLERREYPWEWTLSTDQYVSLMATHSPHAALPDDVRARLLTEIADLIETEFAGSVTENYFAVLHLARRA